MRTAQDAKLSCITRQPIPEHDNTQDARNTRPNRAKHMPTINGPREWTEKGFLAPADEATAIDKNRADKREQTRCNRWRGAHYGSVVLADILIAQHPPFWGEPWRPFSLAPLFFFLEDSVSKWTRVGTGDRVRMPSIRSGAMFQSPPATQGQPWPAACSMSAMTAATFPCPYWTPVVRYIE